MSRFRTEEERQQNRFAAVLVCYAMTTAGIIGMAAALVSFLTGLIAFEHFLSSLLYASVLAIFFGLAAVVITAYSAFRSRRAANKKQLTPDSD